MDENKNFNEEIENAAEDVAENIEEEATDVIEGTDEAIADTADTLEAEIPEAVEEIAEEPAKKGSKLFAIIAVIVAVIVIAAAMITSTIEKNPYNKMGYVNISGKTIQDIVDEQGMELSEFLEMYGLPADMPGDTFESAAYYNIPVSKIAEMYGMDYNTMKDLLKFPDEITENSTWGEAEGSVTLGNYLGEEKIDDFKAEYGLGDDVTKDTLWKEIRPIVDEQQKKKREEQEASKADEDTKTADDGAIDSEDVPEVDASDAADAAETPAE